MEILFIDSLNKVPSILYRRIQVPVFGKLGILRIFYPLISLLLSVFLKLEIFLYRSKYFECSRFFLFLLLFLRLLLLLIVHIRY
jgi:hypothetical protein